MVHINVDSGDWKETSAPMYYSQKKRSWYCKECDFVIQSPRTAGAHAEEHGLPLPFSRNKVEVELVPVVQHKDPEIPTRQTSDEAFKQRMDSYFPNRNRTYNQNSSADYVPLTPFDKKIHDRLQGKIQIQKMRMSDCFSDEEIKEKEEELGLRPKEDPVKNEGLKKAAIMNLQNRYFNEDDEGVQAEILFSMSLIENEKDPNNIPLLLSMAPRPKPKESNSSKKMLLMMGCLYLKRKQEESSLLNNPEKFLELIKILRKKPNRIQSPTETAIPLTPSENGLDQKIKP